MSTAPPQTAQLPQPAPAAYEADAFEPDDDDNEGATNRGYHRATTIQEHNQQIYDETTIRRTEEYRAAWDIELWKAVQLSAFQNEFKETKRKSLEQWKASLEHKEAERMALLDRQSRDLLSRERRIVEEEKLLEKRKQKLVEAEKEFKSLRQVLIDQKQRSDQDAEIRVQRGKEELAHRSELFQQRIQQHEETARRAEERLAVSQQEYIKLFEEFSQYKTRQLANPDAYASHHIERLRADHVAEMTALQDRLDRRHQEHTLTLTMRCQQLEDTVKRLTGNVASRKQSMKGNEEQISMMRGQLEASKREIDRLLLENDTLKSRLELTSRGSPAGAASSPHVQQSGVAVSPFQRQLSNGTTQSSGSTRGGDMPEIEKLREAVSRCAEEDRRRAASQQPIAASSSPSSAQRSSSTFVQDQGGLKSEVQRLERERRTLLEESGGAYTVHSDVIQRMDKRISTLKGMIVF